MENNELLFNMIKANAGYLAKPIQFSFYTVIFIAEGKGIYHADFSTFPFSGPVLLFATPLQQIYIEEQGPLEITMIQFHGDFYCIEYHRAEVSCNGLLFNNCYIEPAVNLSGKDFILFRNLLTDLEQEFTSPQTNETVIRSYLQLWLAKASAIKISMLERQELQEIDHLMEQLRRLIDQHFLTLHKPGDYADLLHISSNSLTKKTSNYFNKTPSQLITERLIIEAKKQLHLTRHSIKEIAYQLNFQDEFYFSRVFKKFTKVSPKAFREKTGISIVASLPVGKPGR
ncbi:helix-turn-helix domain-containing protein [Mucilaginibacter sp. X4EP1]|uniref:helix-turn-helix domain-containing protein n=1 Tax=Mucilaginibacter sp. X4EP1 TaxID=2723092 RepID=UPI003AFF8730